MDYRKYISARNLSWRVLLDGDIRALPIRVSALCRTMGISVKLYDGREDSDGESTVLGGKPMILVSRSKPVPRQRFTAAHELGHILLGHVGEKNLVNREPSPSDSPIEKEANVFASRLLAPACVLWGCGVRSAEDIMELCGISRLAAEFRWQRLQALRGRELFLTSQLERQVYERFEPFIKEHRF